MELLLVGGIMLGTGVLGATAAQAADRYESRTIVTGMDGRSRPAGLLRTLAQVLVKTTGNPALLNDPRLSAIDPAPLLESFAYLDRMANEPKHDEQGTRDRPYDLVARYDPAAIATLLQRWNEPPWTGPRPAVAVAVTIQPRRGPPMPLRADTDADEPHRGALLAAADRVGLALILPAALDPVPVPPAAPVLQGSIRWSDADTGWVAEWRLAWRGTTQAWAIRGTSFDAAYQDAMAGTGRRLSGR